MPKRLTFITTIFLLLFVNVSIAEQKQTFRVPQFSNDKVNVWETVIYPSKKQILKMHRHEHDRVLVAFDDGILKVTNDKSQVHFLKLEKNKSYYLNKDVPNELHMDENLSDHPIKVLVIELNDN